MTWRERLRLAVKSSGVTQTDIARRAGIAPETLSRILNREHQQPSFSIVIRIARAARVKVGWLLDEARGVELTDRDRKAILAAGVILLDVFGKKESR